MKRIIYLILLFSAGLSSCLKDDFHPKWDVDILGPIAKTHLTLDQIVADSLLQINPDSSVSLVYQTELSAISLDTIARLPDTSVNYSAKLNSIGLATINLVHNVSLGAIAENDREMNGQYGGLYEVIMTAHNTGQPAIIDPIAPMVFDSIEIDAGGYYQKIWLLEAYVDIIIENYLPIPLSDLNFTLKNKSDGFTILSDNFMYVAVNSTATKTVYLTNIVLENILAADVTISSPGSGVEVAIDTSQYAAARIVVRDIKIDSALARFPSQEIIAYHNEAVLSLSDNFQLNEVWALSGMISVDIYNTIQESMYYDFEIPGAKLNGVPFIISGQVPAATPGNVAHTSLSKNLAGYKVDFRGIGPFEAINGDLNGNSIIDQDTVNKLYYVLKAGIDSSGNFIMLTLNDSIYASCSISNVMPEYALGFFGTMQAGEDSLIVFDVLNSLEIDELSFDDVRVSLTVENQIGVQATATINELTSINTAATSSISLSGQALNSPFVIAKPADPHSLFVDVVPTVNLFQLNSGNSNISQLISNKPDRFSYNVGININQDVPVPPAGSGTDFIYYGDRISSRLNVEVPLSFIAGNLVLRDTVVPDFSGSDISKINNGNVIIYSVNSYPIECISQIYFLNADNQVYDSLSIIPVFIPAADINPLTNTVTVPKISKNTVPAGKTKLQNFFDAKKLVITARFSTQPPGMHVKIYSNYFVDIKIVGDFNYRIEK